MMGQVRAGYKVNVAIMSFERAVDEVQDWMVLDESTYETIKTNLTIKRDESGTNIYLGLREAKEKLDALTDVDKNGNARSCDVVHSSATMGRVAGSTLQNGWTHVGWAHEIDYGEEATPGVEPGAGIDQGEAGGAAAVGDGLTAGSPAAGAERYAVVASPDGGPVKLRRSASRDEPLYWLVNAGARVRVERERDGWALITAICTDGYTRRAYMMTKYLGEEHGRG